MLEDKAKVIAQGEDFNECLTRGINEYSAEQAAPRE